MPSVSSEIIADISNHISKCGGDFSAWCVGTARDWEDPILEAHEQEEKNDDFICREAYTPASARTVRLHFVNDCGTAQGSGDGVAPTPQSGVGICAPCPPEGGRYIALPRAGASARFERSRYRAICAVRIRGFRN